MRKPHTLNAAETSIESFSKAIYDRLFTWIVGHVNSAIDPTITGIYFWQFSVFLTKSGIFFYILALHLAVWWLGLWIIIK